MTTAAAVARHLIRLAAADPEGEKMTPLRLHKLLYYCQGWSLAWYGRPLFADSVEAWKYGPVVPSVWQREWGQGRDPIPEPDVPDPISAEEQACCEQVWRHYRQFSARGLRDLTHTEAPWVNHYSPDGDGRGDVTIPTADLLDYFGRVYREKTGDEPGNAAHRGGVPLEAAVKGLGW